MSADTSKIRAKLAKLDKSLDQLESQLEPLFAQSLPETLLALDTIQQAKLQVIIPYLVYDLVFVYLKSRGIDPKTHRVVAGLERVRQYFDKIKHAEESVEKKRKIGIDKAAAGRFIKHAIAQAKNAQLVEEPSDADTVEASSSSNLERVPVVVTSKMVARAEYEKELGEMGSEEEDLEVFDEELAGDAMDTTDGPSGETRLTGLYKGKGRATEKQLSKDEEAPSSKRKRPRMDPFSGYKSLSVCEPTFQTMGDSTTARLSTLMESPGDSIFASEDRETRTAAKKAKRKKSREARD